MVQVRRKFVDEFERTGSDIAKHAIKFIADLYAVEKEAKGRSPEERADLRLQKAKPIFDELKAWLQAQLTRLQPHNQNMTVAARAIAERKTLGHLS